MPSPPVATVGNVKGGAGKSTTAVQLALHAARRGLRVLLIDADGGRSTLSWATRAEDWPHDQVAVLPHATPDLPRRLAGFAEGFQLVVIDTPHDPTDRGLVGPMLAAGIAVADLLVVPSPPSPADLDRLGDLLGAIEAEQNRRELAWCLALVRVDLRRRAAVAELHAALTERGLPTLEATVPERLAVADAFGTATVTVEYDALAGEVLGQLLAEAR
jgi:chromosome partitioning protein